MFLISIFLDMLHKKFLLFTDTITYWKHTIIIITDNTKNIECIHRHSLTDIIQHWKHTILILQATYKITLEITRQCTPRLAMLTKQNNWAEANYMNRNCLALNLVNSDIFWSTYNSHVKSFSVQKIINVLFLLSRNTLQSLFLTNLCF